MRSLGLLLLLTLPACTIFFEHGSTGDDDCLEVPTDQAGSLPAPLRNPEILTCDSFGGGCDPSCGPCPLATGGAALEPIPSWGICGSDCEQLDEGTCGERQDCRIVRDVRCAIDGNCFTDFMGCFPTDNFVDRSIVCESATDGMTCSQNPGCTAFHRDGACPPDGSGQCAREFSLCMTAGASPGRCFEATLCDRIPPPCPSGTVPGVIDGCYSDACIPEQDCEQVPPMPQP